MREREGFGGGRGAGEGLVRGAGKGLVRAGRPTGREDQEGKDGGFDQGVDLSRDGLMAHQATARTASHGSVAGGRSHGGQGLHATLGRIGGNGAHEGGALGADREPKESSEADGP